MAVYAVIGDGVVFNTIEWDGETKYNPGDQYIVVPVPDDQGISIGWLWDETNGFIAPQLGINTEE